MPIYWKPEYNVGVREIDRQHKELVKIIRRLYESIQGGRAEGEVEEILESLTEYAKEHFATEEKYFKKFKYEKTKEHEKEHEEFKEKITELISDLENDKMKISFDLVDYLEDWLVKHLMDQDQQYVEYFKENGLK